MATAKTISKATGRRFRVYDPLTKRLLGIVSATSKYAAASSVAARLSMGAYQASLFCRLATVKMVEPAAKTAAGMMTADQAWTKTLAERADAARNKAADAAYDKARVALAETHNAKAAALDADHQAKQDALYAELQTARAALKADYLLAKGKA